MKILMVDKYYFIKGGAERYYFELTKTLEERGHEVIPFSMKHPNNFPTEYEDYFVENIEFNGLTFAEKIRRAPEILTRVIWSTKAKEAILRLVDKVKPDIAHLHMIDHQLSPSILQGLKEQGIPIIQTCHQYKHVCPSYRLYIMHKNQICEKCIPGKYYHAVLEKCHKNSLSASAIVAIESYIHKWMNIYDLIDVFHVPSRFLGKKLQEAGYPSDKIWHCFYTINLRDYPYHPESDDYFVYYGRLSEEKGILTLLKAKKHLPEPKLKIIGDGPQRPVLEDFVRDHRVENVEFLGNRGGEELISLVQNSRFVVVPSEWYDNSPLVIYESFSMGKPVIVSTLGGMPELVEPGEDGFHFPPGDVDELTDRIRTLWQNPELCKRMGEKARQKAEREFSPESHYDQLMKIYQRLTRTVRSDVTM